MLLKNNNGVMNITKKLILENKVKNIYITLAVTLTTMLLTIVFYGGYAAYNACETFFEGRESVTLDAIVPFVIILIITMISGYLIIYNIFYISVVQDIKFYGLLKTVGATRKQIKKIIANWVYSLSIIGMPIGIILGLIVGRYITETLASGMIFYPAMEYDKILVPICLSILFTIATISRSINVPTKIAGKISPIEALGFNSIDTISGNKKMKNAQNGGKIKNMAFRNMIKSKRKVVMSVLSITLSSSLAMTSVVIGLGLDTKEHSKRYNLREININEGHENRKIDEENLKIVENTKGIKTIDTYYRGVENKVVPLEKNDDKNIYKSDEKLIGSYLKANDEMFQEFMGMEGFSKTRVDFNEKKIYTEIVGINSDRLKFNTDRLKVVEGKIDEGKFKSGNYLIINRSNRTVNYGLKAGDKVDIEFVFYDHFKSLEKKEDSIINSKKESFEVMAIVADKDENYTDTNIGDITIEENKMKDIYKEQGIEIKSINIDTEKGMEASVEAELRKNLKGVEINSIQYFQNGVSNIKSAIVGAAIIGTIIFGLIAILNILNTVISNLNSRKREFATLRALGMTQKSLKKMLVYEGGYYLILCAIFMIPLGLGIGMLVPKMIPIYGGFNFMAYIVTIIISLIIIGVIIIGFPIIILNSVEKRESIIERLRED